MKTDDDVKVLIEKTKDGTLDAYAKTLEGSDFALYLPTFVDNDRVRLLRDGHSQTESNLKIKVTNSKLIPSDAKAVAWLGDVDAKDSACRHGTTRTCKHCTSHTKACKHCTSHQLRVGNAEVIDAPELDYQTAIEKLRGKQDVLKNLAKERFGLALLHGHSDKYTFTKLPEGLVSVISNDETKFRPISEVEADETFVPNMWRVSNGKLVVAGGYSQQ